MKWFGALTCLALILAPFNVTHGCAHQWYVQQALNPEEWLGTGPDAEWIGPQDDGPREEPSWVADPGNDPIPETTAQTEAEPEPPADITVTVFLPDGTQVSVNTAPSEATQTREQILENWFENWEPTDEQLGEYVG